MEEARDGRDWAKRVIREERELEGYRLRATLPGFGPFKGDNGHVARNDFDILPEESVVGVIVGG